MTATASGATGDAGRTKRVAPDRLLPTTQLVRISAYWLGLTAIDAAVGLFVANRIAFTNIRARCRLGPPRRSSPWAARSSRSSSSRPSAGISDYAVTKWGRRKPFIVFGSLLDVVFLSASRHRTRCSCWRRS